jgi:hypothetical protein
LKNKEQDLKTMARVVQPLYAVSVAGHLLNTDKLAHALILVTGDSIDSASVNAEILSAMKFSIVQIESTIVIPIGMGYYDLFIDPEWEDMKEEAAK